ncbi:MAG: M48 family metallopeptidase [Candidatus Paceibacterota bacterium]
MHYTLRRSTRARSLRLAVHPDGAIVITAPERYELSLIEKFFVTHAAWAQRKVDAAKKRTVIRVPRSTVAQLKKDALALAHEGASRYARLYGRTYRTITIRAQKSRWGSCSKSGNLSFNYKIAALPTALREYIIVHEICHLAHMDHSRAFWDLVAESVPQHKKRRAELRNIVFTHA